MPTRANIFTAAARWIGGFGGTSRRHPWTGEVQTRRFGHDWDQPTKRAPRLAIARAAWRARSASPSTGIGTGGRIGIGEALGTTVGTHTASGAAITGRMGPGAVIGEGRIGGAANSGSGSGDGSPR